MKNLSTILLLLLFTTIQAQTSVELLQLFKGMNLAGVTITDVEDVPSGNYKLPNGQIVTNLPAFVRVALVSKPTPDSYIRIEVWLPNKKNWNNRFLAIGNGGGGGSINYGWMMSGLKRGFVTANTDMGTSTGVLNCIGHPEKWADFGYRATHEMVITSKAAIKTYYIKNAHWSYYIGCSTGGQQGLMEAQRFPDDFDGIIAGAPANNRTHLHASFIWNLQANHGASGNIVSDKKMELLSKIILQKYVGHDGGAPNDNFLTDPRICKFETSMLPICIDGNTDSCFTTEEIKALEKIYSGPVNPRTGEQIYAPLPMGGTWLENTASHLYLFHWVFGKDFDYMKFDFDRDMAKVDSVLAPVLNANNPDLSGMKKQGGKIIMYTGMCDYLVEFQDALTYYDRVVEEQHGLKETQDFFRFFLVPGMSHCINGPGLSEFGQFIDLSPKIPQDGEHDLLTALMNWVEKNKAPDKLIVSSFQCCEKSDSIRLQRPVFPYPIFPAYIGGNSNLPKNFIGKARPEGGVLSPAEKYLK